MTAVGLHAELVATLVHGARDRYLAGHPASPELRALLADLADGTVTLRQVRAGGAHPGDDGGRMAAATTSSLLVSIGETASALGISRRTLERRLADGTVRSVKLGPRRFVPRQVIDALAAS